MKRATVALIQREDYLLIPKRAKDPYRGRLALIGGTGGFEETDSPAEAVKIEVRADIGATFTGRKVGTLVSEENPEVEQHIFLGDITGAIRPNPEFCQGAYWFHLDEAKRLHLPFGQPEIIRAYALPPT